MIVTKQWQKPFVNQQLIRLFFLLHHCEGVGDYYFAMAGALAAPGKRRTQGAVRSAKRGPVALLPRKVPHVTGRSVPSASDKFRGRGLFLVVVVAAVAGSHCWQAVARSASELL